MPAAQDFLITFATRFHSFPAASIRSVRYQMGLGTRRPMWLPDGRFNTEPPTDHDLRADRLAWAAIREGVRFGLLELGRTSHQESEIVATREIPRELNEHSFPVIPPARIPDPRDPNETIGDDSHWPKMLANLRTRQPTDEFLQLFVEFRRSAHH